jgi:AcrR family transcriptional regulator
MCPQATASSYRTLRADAEGNRLRILDAAGSVFAERGIDASLEEIADRVGLGIATPYRRFPTREDLVAAVFTAKLAEAAEQARYSSTRGTPSATSSSACAPCRPRIAGSPT